MGVRVVGGVKTHGFYGVGRKQTGGKPAAGPKWQRASRDKSKLFTRGGDSGPLVQKGHEIFLNLPGFKPDSPETIAARPGTIFSLTGGFVPTFTQKFLDQGTSHAQQKSGMVTINEALTKSGPGPQMMRGNHVWYNYAKDYLETLELMASKTGNFPKELKANPTAFWADKNNVYSEILNSYQEAAAKHATPLLSSWRDQISTRMKTALTSGDTAVSEDELDAATTGTAVQAAEERAPRLLEGKKTASGDVFKNLESPGSKRTGAKMGIDTMFRIGDRIYKIDLTQSKTTSGSTHSMLGKWKIDVDKALTFSGGFEEGLKDQAAKHYKTKSQPHLNTMLEQIGKLVEEIRKNHEGDKDWDIDARSILEKAKITGGDKVSRDNLEKQFRKAGYKYFRFKTTQKYVNEAFHEVMHILGQVWSDKSSSPGSKGGEGKIFADIGVGQLPEPMSAESVGFVGEHELNQFAVGPIWRVETKGKFQDVVRIELEDVFLELQYENFFDWLMGSDTMLNLGNTERTRIIQQLNIIDMYESMKLSGSEIVIGEAVAGEKAALFASYQVAGGVASFEDSAMNEKLGEALGKIIQETEGGIKNKSFPAEVKKALNTGVTEANKFSRIWKQGGNFNAGVELSTEMIDDQDVALGNAIQERAESAAAGMKGNPQIWSKFNNLLRTYTWATPYVGVFYQAGGSSGKEQLRSGVGGV